MRKFLLAAGSAGAVFVAMTAGQTAPLRDEKAVRLFQPGFLENVDYVRQVKRYCFYVDGWHGPGWYWCGYRHREGLGWGGERGWQGRQEEHREGRGERREDRKEIKTEKTEKTEKKEMKTEKTEKTDKGKMEKTAPETKKTEPMEKK